MSTIAIVKLIESKGKAALDTAVAAYVAGAGAILATNVRAMSMAAYRDPADDSNRVLVAVAHAGEAMPASKVADNQFVFVEADSIAALQTALDLALTNVVHHRRTDGNADTNAGDINVGAAMFQSTDVGRKISIGANERTITAFVSTTRVTYSGTAITGTSLVVQLKGAECISQCHVETFRERDTDPHFSVMLACEGQTA